MSDIFKRYEIKYKVNNDIKEKLIKDLEDIISLDKFCLKNNGYFIYSLYFDSPNEQILRTSISKPIYKEKLRIRSYKINPTNEDFYFLELKKKYNKVGSKRRIKVNNELLNKVINSNVDIYNDFLSNQITKEIRNFIKVNSCYPRYFISCFRLAYVGTYDTSLRITFDSNIIYRDYDVNFNSNVGNKLLDDDEWIMEIKFDGSMPLKIVKILDKYKIYPTSYSKVGKAYLKIKEEKQNVHNRQYFIS